MKFGPITEKLEEIQVNGQACVPGTDCLRDCAHDKWKGSSNKYTKGCYIGTVYDAHWSKCR